MRTAAGQLRDGLAIGTFVLLIVLGLQMSYLLVQAGNLLQRAEGEIAAAAVEMRTTLLYSQAVLSSARQTTELVRRSAEQQMGYYEAAGRRTGLLLANLNLLIANANTHLDELSDAALVTIQSGAQAIASIEEDADRVATRADAALAESERLLADLRQTIAAPEIRGSLEALHASTGNLQAATAEAAKAGRNTAEATGYIRDMLSPTKKSFWRRVLELLIPRPAVAVK